MNNRGYVIVATGDTKYVTCANTLIRSIHRVMPDAKVSIITDNIIEYNNLYDHIIKVDSIVDTTDWRLADDSLVYHHSPYEYTIKLESDIYLPRSIDYWWDILKDRDLNISTTIRDFRGDISTNDYYRQTFVKSGLPQVYNAITYFKKSETAERFYSLVADIFTNWQEYSELLVYSTEDRATTDVAYAIAAKIIGVESCTLPTFLEFGMVHMKKQINNLITERWSDELVYEIHRDTVRINTYPQLYPIHYYNKEFANTIDQELGDD